MIVKDKHQRFKDAPWFLQKDDKQTILIGGAGGTGSWLALFLARANFDIMIYDMDNLESYNLAGQFYTDFQVGKKKVVALSENVRNFASEQVEYVDEAYTENSIPHHLMVSAFDNMKAREIMFNRWCKFIAKYDPEGAIIKVPLFVDMRLLAEQLQIFCVTPENIDRYRKHLFDDSEVPDAPCSFKQTTHSAAMIASHAVGFITNHINNQVSEFKRQVPFYWEYVIPINYIKSEL